MFRPQALIAAKCSAKKRKNNKKKNRRSKQRATILGKNKSNMFQTPTYRCTLNSITPPCTLRFHGCRHPPPAPPPSPPTSIVHPLALLSHHLRPSRGPRLRLLPSFVTFVIGRRLHKPLRQPLNLKKTLQTQSPSSSLAASPHSLR